MRRGGSQHGPSGAQPGWLEKIVEELVAKGAQVQFLKENLTVVGKFDLSQSDVKSSGVVRRVRTFTYQVEAGRGDRYKEGGSRLQGEGVSGDAMRVAKGYRIEVGNEWTRPLVELRGRTRKG